MTWLSFQTKTEMLDNLLEIEVAYSLLKTGDDSDKDPLDLHFEKLKTEMTVSGDIKVFNIWCCVVCKVK